MDGTGYWKMKFDGRIDKLDDDESTQQSNGVATPASSILEPEVKAMNTENNSTNPGEKNVRDKEFQPENTDRDTLPRSPCTKQQTSPKIEEFLVEIKDSDNVTGINGPGLDRIQFKFGEMLHMYAPFALVAFFFGDTRLILKRTAFSTSLNLGYITVIVSLTLFLHLIRWIDLFIQQTVKDWEESRAREKEEFELSLQMKWKVWKQSLAETEQDSKKT